MRGDDGESFPFVRRRGPLALIGLSTSLPTLPLAATGRLHGDQLARLGAVLAALGRDRLFRVILIHHPPVAGANYFRRLTNAAALRDVLREHGAELVLHGHHHEASLAWLPGPQANIPVVGVPSASGAAGHHDDPAGYNLYEIEGAPGCLALHHDRARIARRRHRRGEPPAAAGVRRSFINAWIGRPLSGSTDDICTPWNLLGLTQLRHWQSSTSCAGSCFPPLPKV